MPTVLITGASRGIGRAAALAFAKKGYCIAVNYRQDEAAARALQARLKEMQVYARVYRADVADESQVARMARQIEDDMGSVDVLVNNAGCALSSLFCDTSTEKWERIFAVNVTGAFFCIKETLPKMIEKKKGCIVNVSSIWGITGASCEVAYSASKAALIGLTKALAKETAPSGVRVNCVAPGVIHTGMNANLDEAALEDLANSTPMQRMGSAEEIANVIVFLCEEESSFMTGQVLSPNGGILI